MRYINHKSDFQVIINIKDKEGNIVAPPSVPWETVFSDENCVEFKCYFDGANYTHCIVDGNDIVCFVDNPGFACGKLRCTFYQHVPSEEYCDGVMDLSQPLQCDIMLSKRESDDSTTITIDASPNWVRGPQGIKGDKGDKGEKGDKGDTGEKGDDGFSPIVLLTKQGAISTLSITDAQGEHTTEISDGAKGDKGEKGDTGSKGEKGDDGVSPTVTTSKTGKVTTIEITDAQGTHTATVNDGESVEIVQSTGTSETSVMSQKAVSDALSTKVGNTELDSYATKEYVQTNAPQETKESIEEKLGAWLEEDGGEADGEVYTKSESDAMLAEKQNVLTAGNGITIEGGVISVEEKKFTVWSNPRIDEYVTTFTNFGYNDDGTQKTSGSSVRSWVFKIGNYGHKKVYFNVMNAWMCDGLDDAQNMINPTLLGKGYTFVGLTVNITSEHIGKYIVGMSISGYGNLLGTEYCRCVQFCDEKTQAELDADERMLSDMYAGNLMRYAVATSVIGDTPTLEWGNGAYLDKYTERKIFLDIVSRPNIAYECKVAKNLNYLYQCCGRLIDITPLWDTSLVTTMRCAFQMCRSLKYADLSHLNLSSVTDSAYLFNLCIALIEAKLPSLPAVTSCYYMFSRCSSLQSVTLPELPAVTNCYSMFDNCSSLQSLYIDMPNCEKFDLIASNCTSLHTIEIVDMRKATSFTNPFYQCLSLENVTCVEELPKCAISFSNSSKLTLDSVTNIITHLPDLNTEDSKTLTLHATTKALLTEALIAEATSKNWIIA